MKSLLFVVITLLSVLSIEIPTIQQKFCSDNVDYVTVNGTIQQEFQYKLCMNRDELKYRREDAKSNDTTLVSLLNNNVLYEFYEKESVINCTKRTLPTNVTNHDIPFSFLILDEKITFADNETFHNIPAEHWYDNRTIYNGSAYVHIGDMNWLVSQGEVNDLLLTSYVQHYDKHPGDHGNSTTMKGNRDFSANYTRVVSDSLFDPPMNCQNTSQQQENIVESQKLNGETTVVNVTANITLDNTVEDGLVTIEISGPADVWFGVGFNASTMSDLPWVILVEIDEIDERKLGNHAVGVSLPPITKQISNTVTNGIRTSILQRPFLGTNSNYYNFSMEETNIPIIAAYGSSSHFSYHAARGNGQISLKQENLELPSNKFENVELFGEINREIMF